MKRLITILLLLITILGLLYLYRDELGFLKNTAYAVGDLTVDWGIGIGNVGPIFSISNFAPGETESRNVDVSNGAPSVRSVGVRGLETTQIGTISSVLDIVISEGGTDLYGGASPGGPKTLSQFFTESEGPDGIPLSNLASGSSTTYNFKVTFSEGAGNEFQNTQVIFDLKIGISINLPDSCDQLDLLSTPIIGTSKAETLTGTSGNDLIMGLEGADRINGNGGDDCILGGNGADTLNGNAGNDAIFGEGGADSINGNNGNDFISGGTGADSIKGESGQDQLFGDEDADIIKGGGDDDVIEGGSASDTLEGENGADTIRGNGGADTLRGGSGDDNLDGGAGMDSANGNAGIDICVAESKNNCEL